jgi:ATP-binding cassette subfamily F protein 3
MTVLQVADLSFGYAGDTLFENVTFTLALGERAALVAPNGAGKSTLLRIIAKEIEPDRGLGGAIKKECTFGYYRQSHELKAEGDVLGAFLSGFAEVVTLREELTRAQHDAASGEDKALASTSRT